MMAGHVLLVGCPSSYDELLPQNANAVHESEGTATQLADAAVIVLGAELSRPLFVAQRLTRTHQRAELVIVAGESNLAEVRSLLQITPFVPVGTCVVGEDPESLHAALQRAFARAASERRQRRILARISMQLSAPQTVLPARTPPPAVPVAAREKAAFRQFIVSNQKSILDEIGAALRRGGLNPVAAAEMRATGLSLTTILDHDAAKRSDWDALWSWLRRQGQALAESGVAQHDWTRAWLVGCDVCFDRILQLVNSHPQDEMFRATLAGCERFFSRTLAAVSDGYHAASLQQRRAYTSRDQLFASVVESSTDAIFSFGLNGVITSWNGGAEALYGYQPDEAVGRSISTLMPRDATLDVGDIINRIGLKNSVRIETRLQRKGAQSVEVAVTFSPIVDPDGRVTGASSIGRDITARLESKRRLVRAAENLRRSNEELEQFAFVASHDLQEPLRMVSSYMQLLEQELPKPLDETIAMCVRYAGDGARRMKALIDSILSFSRVRTGGQRFELCQVESVLAQVQEMLAPAIVQSGAKISHGPLPEVWADATQLGLVFQNLIGNALKFRSKKVPDIHVEAIKGDDLWTFRVQDNGIGFEPKHEQRIFQMFQRLHGRAAYEGTGIGLAISKRIIQRHGGKIWAEGTPGEGSCFIFQLHAGEPPDFVNHTESTEDHETPE